MDRDQQISAEAASRAQALVDLMEVTRRQNENIDQLTHTIAEVSGALGARPTRKETVNLTALFILVAMVPVALFVLLGWMQARANSDVLNILRECTSRSTTEDVHECYEQVQERNARVVSSITQVMIFTQECALTDAGKANMEECVQAKVAMDAATTTTTFGSG